MVNAPEFFSALTNRQIEAAVAALVQQLDADGAAQQNKAEHQGSAALGLWKLMVSSRAHVRAAAQAGAIEKLAQILKSPPEQGVSGAVAAALVELTVDSTNRARAAAACGVLKAAAKLAHCGISAVCPLASALMHNLLHQLEPAQLPERQLGLVQDAALHLLRHCNYSDSERSTGDTATRTLFCLAKYAPAKYGGAALDAGVMPLLGPQIKSADIKQRASAAFFIEKLLPMADDEQAAAAVAAGVIEEAAKLLQAEPEHAEAGGWLLSALCERKEEWGRRAADAGAVPASCATWHTSCSRGSVRRACITARGGCWAWQTCWQLGPPRRSVWRRRWGQAWQR